MTPKTKVDLAIIKRLLAELESSLATAEAITTDVNADKIEYIVEMNKATGLAAGLMTEAGLLMGDLQHLIQGVSTPGASKSDFLDKLLGGLKGPGNAN
jgi:hypothetical protein